MKFIAKVEGEVNAQAQIGEGVNVDALLNSVEDYNTITNKPSINGVILVGNKTSTELGLPDYEKIGVLRYEDQEYPITDLRLDYSGSGGLGIIYLNENEEYEVVYLPDGASLERVEEEIPTKTSDLQNDSGFITSAALPTKTSDLQNDSGFITSSALPTKTSDLQNDSGFITISDVPTKTSDLQNDSDFVADASYVHTDNNYTDADEAKVAALGNWALSNEPGGVAKKTSGILFGQVDDTSTSTEFTATVGGFTELYDGLCVYLMNGVVSSASGFTLNINNTGDLPVYTTLSAASRGTTIFNINYSMLFIYNSKRVSGGCWDIFYGYDSNTNTIGYQLRTNSQTLPMKEVVYRYRLLFTAADGKGFVPANSSNSTNATAKRNVTQSVIDPFAPIYYYGTTASVAVDSRPSTSYLWQQYNITLGYSFNRTGAALTLTPYEPVYLKCEPQSSGGVVIDPDTPYVQSLPTTADGKVYLFLGICTAATTIEILPYHPVYYYVNGGISLWTGEEKITSSTVANFEIVNGDLIVTDKNGNTHTIAMS